MSTLVPTNLRARTCPPPTIQPPPFTPAGYHNPTPSDIHRARILLTRRLGVPAELTLLILSLARYNPRLHTQLSSAFCCAASHGKGAANIGCHTTLIAAPIPRCCRRVRRITWWTRSHDQGWSGEGRQGTYSFSHTWFEAGILRSPHPHGELEQGLDVTGQDDGGRWAREDMVGVGEEGCGRWGRSWLVQRNVQAEREVKEHVVVWERGVAPKEGEQLEDDGDWTEECGSGGGKEFVEELMAGDRVVLFARAMFPCWLNNVEGAEVEIEYEIY